MTESDITDGIPDFAGVSRRDVLGGGTVIAAAAICSDTFAPALAAGNAQPVPLPFARSAVIDGRRKSPGRAMAIDRPGSVVDGEHLSTLAWYLTGGE